jgi:hypothetical protein
VVPRRGDERARSLIIVRATDTAGRSSLRCETVVVAKSQSQASINAVNAAAASVRSYALTHEGAAPPGYFVLGDGPVIGPKQ